MDSAIMEEVLKEILQQQKEMAEEFNKEVEARQDVLLKLEEFHKKLDALKVPVNTDVSQVLPAIRQWIQEVKVKIDAQLAQVKQPTTNGFFSNRSEEFYKLVLAAVTKGVAILIVGIYSLVVLNGYIREREYLHYKQAWQYLYSNQKEDYKIYLERIWNESQKKDTL